MKILLIEDDPAFAQWVCRTLVDHWPGAQVLTAQGLAQARAVLTGLDACDVAIVDLNLGEENGIDVIPALLQRCPDTPVLIVTSVDTPARALDAIRVGAQGYILKATVPGELVRIVQHVLDGGSPITPSIARQLLMEFRAPRSTVAGLIPDGLQKKLTERETDVLRLLARGYSDKEIAANLKIAPMTVDTHVRKIYRKLCVNSRVELRRLLAV